MPDPIYRRQIPDAVISVQPPSV